jgi:hypothetical protein
VQNIGPIIPQHRKKILGKNKIFAVYSPIITVSCCFGVVCLD